MLNIENIQHLPSQIFDILTCTEFLLQLIKWQLTESKIVLNKKRRFKNMWFPYSLGWQKTCTFSVFKNAIQKCSSFHFYIRQINVWTKKRHKIRIESPFEYNTTRTISYNFPTDRRKLNFRTGIIPIMYWLLFEIRFDSNHIAFLYSNIYMLMENTMQYNIWRDIRISSKA